MLFLVLPILATAAPQTRHVPEELTSQVNRLIYAAKYDSAQQITLNYLHNEQLTDLERYYGHLLYAETIRASGRPVESVSAFYLALNIAKSIPDNRLILSLGYKNLAASYFDIPDYSKANEYAEKSITLSPDSTLAEAGHATNYLITGYYHFVNRKFAEAFSRYQKAQSEYLKIGARCELPLVYTKLAEMYDAQDKTTRALAYIDSSRLVSKTCDILLYRILTEKTQYRIHRKNKDYRQAVETYEEIARLQDMMHYREQQMRMESMEKEFERRLQESEVRNLLNINEKNETILAKQKQIIWIAVSAAILMAVMVVLLFLAHQRRLRAMNELEQLNARLEENVASRTAHLVEANDRIRQHSEIVSEQNQKLVDFYHIITHNLRAPLANLSGLIELIKQTTDANERQELMAHIAPSVNSMNTTVNELLEAVQMSVRNEDVPEPSAFEGAFASAVDGLKSQIEMAEAEIQTDFSDAPEVHYPAQLLVSLFHNLLSNSLKYRAESRKPEIQVRSSRKEGKIVLEFKDNGLGMDLEKYGDRLFKAGRIFHQHPEAKGFGLYMTRMQVENYGGQIRAESHPDDGASFFVTFQG